jgi:DNA-3-methyladenine glycosylase II
MKAILRTLGRTDPRLKELMKRVGPPAISRSPGEPFEALLRSIVYQQLSGKAAATIMGRVVALVPKGHHQRPEAFLKLEEAVLRGAGLSRQKTKYVLALCEAAMNGGVPSRKEARKLTDDELIERLTQINGIGRWSVEMLLIFNLQRLDVLPATDLGVRKGFALTFGKKHKKKGELELPTPKEILAYGERWRPYRSIPSWYMWRATELVD